MRTNACGVPIGFKGKSGRLGATISGPSPLEPGQNMLGSLTAGGSLSALGGGFNRSPRVKRAAADARGAEE